MAQPSVLVHRSRVLARMVLVGTAALLVLLIAIFLVVPHESMPEPLIIFWGLFILITALIAGTSTSYLFLTRVPSVATSEPGFRSKPESGAPRASVPELEDLALRLLDGDERRLIRVIVEARRDVFQRDLVTATAFSDAKVSRLLDRLEERGLVIRERQGMTNRVRLTLKQG